MTDRVYLIRTCGKGGKSHDGFCWPLEVGATVSAPDANRDEECGGGLHGLVNGVGDWSIVTPIDSDCHTIVFSCDAADVIDLGDKSKCVGEATVEFAAEGFRWADALQFVWGKTGEAPASYSDGSYGHSSSHGYYSHSSSHGSYGHSSSHGCFGHSSSHGSYGHSSSNGYFGHSSSHGSYGHSSSYGHYSHSSSHGNYGHSSSHGYFGHSSSYGDYGHSSSYGRCGHSSSHGYYSHSSSHGHAGIAAALGQNSRVKASKTGAIIASWWDHKADRPRLLVGYPGEDGIKADIWYRVKDGEWIEDDDQGPRTEGASDA